MKLLIFILSLLMFNSFFANGKDRDPDDVSPGSSTEASADQTSDDITADDIADILDDNTADKPLTVFKLHRPPFNNANTLPFSFTDGWIQQNIQQCKSFEPLGKCLSKLKVGESTVGESKKKTGSVQNSQCTEKVKRMKKCCNSKEVLSCLTGQTDSDEEAGMLSQITEFVSLSSGGMGGGALVLGSSAIKSKGMCSFLELASKAYTAVNTLALGYCGKLMMDAKDACTSDEKPDQEKYYKDESDQSKKELYWYVAKIGSGIYSAYKSNKCQKKIEEQNARNRAQTLARQTKPLHCTSGLMVAYDSKCSDYCAAINHGDPICRNVPRVPGAVRNQYNNSYQAQFNRTNPFLSRNRFLRKDKRSLSSVEKQQKTLFKENKKYTKSLFSKMTQKMNEKLRQNKKNKSSFTHQKYLSQRKKKNNYSYTSNKSSFLTKKDIFQTVSTAYSKICENNSCYRFDEK